MAFKAASQITRTRPLRAAAKPLPKELKVRGIDAPLTLARGRQKHMNLRINPKSGMVHVTAPYYTPEAEVENFVRRNRDWLQAHLSQLAPEMPFADGGEIPLLGQRRVLRHTPGHIGGVRDEGHKLTIGGEPSFLPRRVRDYLVARARREITMRAHYYAGALGKKISAITIRDTTSRWGSCSTGGRLSFSWRLVMMPLHVLDYVVAHEVAHLAHMDHSPAFWAQVQTLLGSNPAPAKKWLAANGNRLMRYGVNQA